MFPLANIPEGDKNTELLQVIMGEIGNLKSELKASRPRAKKDRELPTQGHSVLYEVHVQGREEKVGILAQTIELAGWSRGVPSIQKVGENSVIRFAPEDFIKDDHLKSLIDQLGLNLKKITRYQ